MKKLSILLVLIAPFVSLSCKKADNRIITPSANILVANMVTGGATLTFNTTVSTVSNNSSASFPLLAGQNQINLSNTAVSPAVSYYNQALPTTDAVNYSLFLGGASPTQIDPVLITESYHNYTDSVCAVRFINLSPGSSPISVNITGQSNGSEVASLAYKAYSSFKQYPAKKANSSYAFQIKDATTGNLIASYNLSTPYFHNVTIVLRGLISSPGITMVTHP